MVLTDDTSRAMAELLVNPLKYKCGCMEFIFSLQSWNFLFTVIVSGIKVWEIFIKHSVSTKTESIYVTVVCISFEWG